MSEDLPIEAMSTTLVDEADTTRAAEAFVEANGVRLHYLDWGGQGEPLILLHGVTDNPHAFDDLAPAFTDRFRVLAYARRGHGQSDDQPPYDTGTLTQDLAGFMDALGMQRAHLVGWSMGGNEITEMAGRHPDRVRSLIYLDGAYDWSDYKAAFAAMSPGLLEVPANALTSVDAYLKFKMATEHPRVTEPRRLEAYLRESVIIQPDGAVKFRMADSTVEAFIDTLLNDSRDYTRVRAPALAIYADAFFDLYRAGAARRETALLWERQYMAPFRLASIERVRRELLHVEFVTVAGAHSDFFLTCRAEVVLHMRRFLEERPDGT